MTITFFLFLLGFFALVAGAELLIRGASQLAAGIGVTPLVIGLTIVAYGTSSPELALGISACLQGEPDIALGSVIGSNIINVLCVLGLSAIICPIVIRTSFFRWDVIVMVAASMFMWYSASTGTIDFDTGICMMAILISYTILVIANAKMNREPSAPKATYRVNGKLSHSRIIKDGGMALSGVLLLAYGADWMVEAAVVFAESLGLSEMVISLTVIAFVASLPEIVTTVMAAVRRKGDIAVGSMIGSNIFNILGVLGASAVLAPEGIEVAYSTWAFDVTVMVAVAISCLPIIFGGHVISRWDGAIFCGYYLAYTFYYILDMASHPWAGTFRDGMLYFVVPFSMLTLGLGVYRHLKKRASSIELPAN